MLKRYIILLLAIFGLTILLAAGLTTEQKEKLNAAKDETTVSELVHQYAGLTDNIDDLRLLQDYWLNLNPEECNTFFTNLKSQHPNDEKYLYLWARTVDDSHLQITTGRQLIKQNPAFTYGYRLLLGTYQKELFSTPGPDHPTAQPWLKDFQKDKKYFAQYLKKFPQDETAMYQNLQLLVWEKKVKEANKLLARAQAANMDWLTWQFFTDYYLKTDQLVLLQAYLRRLIDTSNLTQSMTAEEKESQFELAYLNTLLYGERYPDLIAYVQAHPQTLQQPDNLKMYLVACTRQGETDKAFTTMDIFLTQPNGIYNWILTDPDLTALRQDPRWNAKNQAYEAVWNAGRNDRKSEVTATKFSRPAPLWELKDKDGNMVKLAEQKGNIVILDFWATWCGPCKMAMPVLDAWMKNKMPAGVKVYSINVWERDPSLPAPYMTDNGYAMTLLYGTDNLSTEYNFDGIPYLCVIDGEGNIRYEEKGYTTDLEENLSFWVEDLLNN